MTYQKNGESDILLFMKRKTQMSKCRLAAFPPCPKWQPETRGLLIRQSEHKLPTANIWNSSPPPVPQITENPGMVAIPWENVLKTCTTRALFCFPCSVLAALGSIQLHPSNPTPMLLNHYVHPNAWRGHQPPAEHLCYGERGLIIIKIGY